MLKYLTLVLTIALTACNSHLKTMRRLDAYSNGARLLCTEAKPVEKKRACAAALPCAERVQIAQQELSAEDAAVAKGEERGLAIASAAAAFAACDAVGVKPRYRVATPQPQPQPQPVVVIPSTSPTP